MKNVNKVLLGLALLTFGSQAQAVPCGDPGSGVFMSDTSTAAWSSCMDGETSNDPYPGSLLMDGVEYDGLQRYNWGEGLSTEVDIDLAVTPVNQSPDGTWSFTNLAAYDSYVIVLKDGGVEFQGVEAKWSAYLLDSALFSSDAGSTWAGDWVYGGGHELSHLTVYGAFLDEGCTGDDCTSAPEPGIAGLLAIGLLGMFATRRRMKV